MSSIGFNPQNKFALQSQQLAGPRMTQAQVQQPQVQSPISFAQRVNPTVTAQQSPISAKEFTQVAEALSTNYRAVPGLNGTEMGVVGKRLSIEA